MAQLGKKEKAQKRYPRSTAASPKGFDTKDLQEAKALLEELTRRDKRHPRRAEVNRREWHQQQRLANSMRSGRLPLNEASQLEGQAAALKRQERQGLQANGGYLTKQQQRQLNREEDGLSHEIYREKQ